MRVKHGFRYLLRLINANAHDCPISLSAHGHSLEILAADGNPVQSMTGTHVVLFPGTFYFNSRIALSHPCIHTVFTNATHIESNQFYTAMVLNLFHMYCTNTFAYYTNVHISIFVHEFIRVYTHIFDTLKRGKKSANSEILYLDLLNLELFFNGTVRDKKEII